VVDSIEDRPDPVIVDLRQRIELVVVTPAAVDGQSQERARDRPDHLGQFLLTGPPHLALARTHMLHLVPFPGDEKPGGGDAVAGGVGQDVAGDLLADELVVGEIGVETVDDIIAVTPRVRAELVVFETVTLGVADHVQPVAAPTFAVVRRGEQSVHQSSLGVRGPVGQECCQLLRSGAAAGSLADRPAD